MTDLTLTLTEFLFERFAEDEVVAQNALVLYAPGSSGYADHYNPARVLAECEKNRRIVALHEIVAHLGRDATRDRDYGRHFN